LNSFVSTGQFPGSDGTLLFFERQGKGKTIILCDGLMCEGHIWKYLVPKLKNEYEFIHWNYPGHGKSDNPSGFYDVSITRLADDVASLVEHIGRDRAVIIGHSLGVQVALETWHRHRELVDAMILICGSPGNLIRDFHENAILGYLVPVLSTIGRVFPGTLSAVWRRLPLSKFSRIAMHSREVNSRLINASDIADYFSRLPYIEFRLALQMLERAGRHDATPYLDKIDVPVLVIAGRDDTFTPAYRSSLMADRIKNSQMMMVAGGTHSLPIEQPDLVNLRILRFLKERL